MAGKHSKSFLDSIKFNNKSCTVETERPPLLLPFKVIIAVFVVLLVLSAVWIASYFIPSRTNKSVLDDAAQIFNSNDSASALNTLMGQNNDIKGWLKIEGTNIDYPICQTDDNSYYMNHNHLKEKSRYGALFLMAEDSFENKDNDYNKVIYGNNMKDETMFGSLKKLRDINFYKQHPTVNLYYADKAETYVVFAVMLIDKSEDKVFNPLKGYFKNEAEFDEWHLEASKRSIIKSNVDVSYQNDLLTLVTPADDFDGARLVVMAKRVEDEEVPHINTSMAAVNSEIKYPKRWYESKGLKYPY